MTRIVEVTHDPVPEVVFDIAVFDDENRDSDYGGVTSYRARRIADFYPTSVGVSSASPSTGALALVWNAVPEYTYKLSTSEDLVFEPAERSPVIVGWFAYLDRYRVVHTRENGQVLVARIGEREESHLFRIGDRIRIRARRGGIRDGAIHFTHCSIVPNRKDCPPPRVVRVAQE